MTLLVLAIVLGALILVGRWLWKRAGELDEREQRWLNGDERW